jgi:hypothetical protein
MAAKISLTFTMRASKLITPIDIGAIELSIFADFADLFTCLPNLPLNIFLHTSSALRQLCGGFGNI